MRMHSYSNEMYAFHCVYGSRERERERDFLTVYLKIQCLEVITNSRIHYARLFRSRKRARSEQYKIYKIIFSLSTVTYLSKKNNLCKF